MDALKICPYCQDEHTDMGRYCSDECRDVDLGKDQSRVDWDLRPADEDAPEPRGQGSRSP